MQDNPRELCFIHWCDKRNCEICKDSDVVISHINLRIPKNIWVMLHGNDTNFINAGPEIRETNVWNKRSERP